MSADVGGRHTVFCGCTTLPTEGAGEAWDTSEAKAAEAAGTAGGLVAEIGSGVTGIRGGRADGPADDPAGATRGVVATGVRGEVTGATGEGTRPAVGIPGGEERGAEEATKTGALGPAAEAAWATGSDIIEGKVLLLAGTTGMISADGGDLEVGTRGGDRVGEAGETGVTEGVTD